MNVALEFRHVCIYYEYGKYLWLTLHQTEGGVHGTQDMYLSMCVLLLFCGTKSVVIDT